MEYPKRISLFKIKTLDNAEIPQEDKYPSNSYIKMGYLFEHTLPKVGYGFGVFQSKTYCNFVTSVVTEILEQNEEFIIIKTLNSLYRIEITDDFE